MNCYHQRFHFLLIVSVLIFSDLFSSCETEKHYFVHTGYAEGTTFSMIYQVGHELNAEITDLLANFERSLSTYDSSSIISGINRNNPDIEPDEYFNRFFTASKKVSEMTEGAFDITVAPIVNAWGFGFTDRMDVDSILIDSLMNYVGMEKVRMENNKVVKQHPNVQLDGNAIAQGLSVDVVSEFLEQQGSTNYMVEIGGEVRVKGRNRENLFWKIGIDKPIENQSIMESEEQVRELQKIMTLSDIAIATSGNYRRYSIMNGIKYSHTIDPKTGYPTRHSLLSASVLTSDCMTADALATAFMVMGLEKSIAFIESHVGIDAFLIYSVIADSLQIYESPGLKNILEKP